MLQLRPNTYFASTASGSFLLAAEGLLRLDEVVDQETVDSLFPDLVNGQCFEDLAELLPAERREAANKLLRLLAFHGLVVIAGDDPPGPPDPPDPPDHRREPATQERFRVHGPAAVRAVGGSRSVPVEPS